VINKRAEGTLIDGHRSSARVLLIPSFEVGWQASAERGEIATRLRRGRRTVARVISPGAAGNPMMIAAANAVGH
jgi:hypothetical protein